MAKNEQGGEVGYNTYTAPNIGYPGYDPSYNYDYIYKKIINNINNLPKYAELDATSDEKS